VIIDIAIYIVLSLVSAFSLICAAAGLVGYLCAPEETDE